MTLQEEERFLESIGDGVVERFYSGVARYTPSTFSRMKPAEALASRSVSPHIHETGQDARSQLRRQVTPGPVTHQPLIDGNHRPRAGPGRAAFGGPSSATAVVGKPRLN